MADTAEAATRGEASRGAAHGATRSPDFERLVAKRWSVSGLLLVLLSVVYYGYVIVLGSDPEVMARRIGEHTTLGIPVGIGVIVFAFVLTAIYIAWANSAYDPEVERLKRQLEPQ